MSIEKTHNLFNQIYDKCDLKSDTFSKKKYSHDWSSLKPSMPSIVIFPRTESQIIETVKICRENNLNILTSGGRTGLSGGATCIDKEIVVSLEKMNRIVEVNIDNQEILCEPGVTTLEIQELARKNNLYYPVDFSSAGSSHIGGNIATNAGGIKVLKYGSTSKYILGLRAVDGKSNQLNYDRKLIKNATGPDQKNFFVGSEGIFGIITSCRIRLIKPPKKTKVCLLSFNNINSCNEIIHPIRYSDNIEAIEFFTKDALTELENSFDNKKKINISGNYYLIIEYSNDNFLDYLEHLFNNKLIKDVLVSQSDSDKKDLWDNRLLLSESLYTYKPLKFDIATPVNRTSDLVSSIENFMLNLKNINVSIFGHLGDGNLHINFYSKSENGIDSKCQNKISNFIYETIFNLGGTISAEHGIGFLKKDLFYKFNPKFEINAIKSLKKSYDPDKIFNPAKIID